MPAARPCSWPVRFAPVGLWQCPGSSPRRQVPAAPAVPGPSSARSPAAAVPAPAAPPTSRLAPPAPRPSPRHPATEAVALPAGQPPVPQPTPGEAAGFGTAGATTSGPPHVEQRPSASAPAAARSRLAAALGPARPPPVVPVSPTPAVVPEPTPTSADGGSSTAAASDAETERRACANSRCWSPASPRMRGNRGARAAGETALRPTQGSPGPQW